MMILKKLWKKDGKNKSERLSHTPFSFHLASWVTTDQWPLLSSALSSDVVSQLATQFYNYKISRFCILSQLLLRRPVSWELELDVRGQPAEIFLCGDWRVCCRLSEGEPQHNTSGKELCHMFNCATGKFYLSLLTYSWLTYNQ